MNSSHPLFDQVAATVARLFRARPERIELLPGGASLRRYYRIFVPSRPALLLMELGETPGSDEAVHDTPIQELPFVNIQRYLRAGGVAVPEIYHYDLEAGLIYLEDLGDLTLELAVQDRSPATLLVHYHAAIDTLVAMQTYTRDNPDPTCVAFSRQFDQKLLRWELDHFLEYGLGELGLTLGATQSRAIHERFDELACRLDGVPKQFVHRDFQSRNLMVQTAPSGSLRVGIIDFQDALLGTQVYDLVGLLRDSYIELDAAILAELVSYYGEKSGADPSFVELFYLQTVQRKLKDIGRFVFIEDVKKLPGYKKYIPASLRYVKAALLQLPAFSPILELLERAKT